MDKEGYKETILGTLPKDWNVDLIDECCKILDKHRVPLNQKERNEIPGDIPYYGANGIVDYIGEYIFDEKLILLAEDGGHFEDYRNRSIAYIIEGKSWVNNHAHVLKPKDKYHLEWIYYTLVHKNILPYVYGSTRMKLNQKSLKTIPIQIPSLPEQKKIASILSSVDKSIEKTDEVIEETKELKKGLMQELLTKGIGHSEFKEVKVGPFEIKVPKEWEVLDFKDVLDSLKSGLSRRLQSEDVGVPVIRSTNMVDGKINFEDIKYWYWDDPKGANVENYLLKDGDILVNFINSMAHIGKACIYRDMGRKVIYTTNVFRTRVNNDIIRNKYFYYYTQSNQYQKEIERISKQAVNQASFTTGDFKNIFIPLPPLEEQKKIASILSSVDKKLQKEEEYKTKLERLKKGLMQKLLTGEIRVNTDMEV